MWEDIDGGGCFIVIYVFSKGLLIGEVIFFWVIKLFFLIINFGFWCFMRLKVLV